MDAPDEQRKERAFEIAREYPYSPAAVYDVLTVCRDDVAHAKTLLSAACRAIMPGTLAAMLDVLDPELILRRRL